MDSGLSNLIIMLVIVAYWAIPLAAAAWALVTLYRIRAEQQAVHRKLEVIERLLERS